LAFVFSFLVLIASEGKEVKIFDYTIEYEDGRKKNIYNRMRNVSTKYLGWENSGMSRK
jgi:hypothetical protein